MRKTNWRVRRLVFGAFEGAHRSQAHFPFKFAMAMSMPSVLVYLFEHKSAVYYCGADGIYKRRASPVADVTSGENAELLSDDDDDIFCLAEEPERKRPKIDDLGAVPVGADVEKLYKYKHPAVAFARSGNSLFSLHRGRVKHKFHVERTDVTKFTCENSCLLKLDHPDGCTVRPWLISAGLVLYAGVSEDGAHRILLGRDCEVSALREAAYLIICTMLERLKHHRFIPR